jgi:hypothetical protein
VLVLPGVSGGFPVVPQLIRASSEAVAKATVHPCDFRLWQRTIVFPSCWWDTGLR